MLPHTLHHLAPLLQKCTDTHRDEWKWAQCKWERERWVSVFVCMLDSMCLCVLVSLVHCFVCLLGCRTFGTSSLRRPTGGCWRRAGSKARSPSCVPTSWSQSNSRSGGSRPGWSSSFTRLEQSHCVNVSFSVNTVLSNFSKLSKVTHRTVVL